MKTAKSLLQLFTSSFGPSFGPFYDPSVGQRIKLGITMPLCLLSLYFIPLILPATTFAAPAPFKVVLDPGHGGQDLGTSLNAGTHELAEKEITLALAHETASLLKKKGIAVHLTRTDDQSLSLPERSQIANRHQAHLFISIHVNSKAQWNLADAQGVETYILNTKSGKSSERLAQFENKVSDLPDDVWRIVHDLKHDAHIGQSKKAACWIQNEVSKLSSRPKNRGIKQALFHVLLGAEMPSVLLEVGFLTSNKDRAMLLSPHKRKEFAQALSQAIDQFRNHRVPPSEHCKLY